MFCPEAIKLCREAALSQRLYCFGISVDIVSLVQVSTVIMPFGPPG